MNASILLTACNGYAFNCCWQTFFIMDLPKKKQKCYNCKHAGQQFKVVGKTHLHCEHPKWKEKHEESEHGISAWDTLCEWWDTCSDFEPKQA